MKKLTKAEYSTWELPEFKIDEFKEKKTKYCVIMPVINEGKKIQNQLKKMYKYSKLADIMICDGGSTDGSMDKKFLRKYGVRTLLTKLSPGRQGTQFRMGCSYLLKQGYEGVVILDGNDKDDPKSIPLFLEALDQGYGYVQGSRFIKGGKHVNTPLSRVLGDRLLHSPILSLASGYWYTDTTNGFRCLSAELLRDPRLAIFRNNIVKYEFFYYITARANRLGYKTKELPVTRRYPKGLVPTKIHGFKGNLGILTTAIKALLGYYNP